MSIDRKPSNITDAGLAPVHWVVSREPVDYLAAVAAMEARVGEIARGNAGEMIWLLEHPAIYTAGTSARDEDLLSPQRFPVYRSGRGGQLTYHGPGQRVVYVMLDVKRRTGDVRKFVGLLEHWLIATLARFGVVGQTRTDRVGVWTLRPELGPAVEDKIAAVGIRVRRWVSFHGLSVNVSPDLEHFSGIVPCGISEHGVTSLADLGISAGMDSVDAALAATFEDLVGPIEEVEAENALPACDLGVRNDRA